MTWWQALLLGLIEGITEYLPVSSTGHLILGAWLLGLGSDPERWTAAFTFNVVIQSGAIAAVALVYRERFRRMLAGLAGRDPAGRRLAVRVIVAFLPSAILGPLLGDAIEARLNGPWPVVQALFAGAVLMLAVARWRRGIPPGAGRDLESITVGTAFAIGCAQCVAMWPGTSRSMMTIVAAFILGLRSTAAAEFSFFLGLVTLSAATAYKLASGGPQMIAELGAGALALGCAASTVSAALTVTWFVRVLNQRGLAPFGWYRLLVAGLLTTALAARWLEIPVLPGGDGPLRDLAGLAPAGVGFAHASPHPPAARAWTGLRAEARGGGSAAAGLHDRARHPGGEVGGEDADDARRETVHRAVDEDRLAADGPHGLIRHVLGGHPREAGDAAHVDLGAGLELGAREPRADAEHVDAGARHLGGDGFGEALHERLGRAVGRHVRPRHEAGDGGDVHHRAAAAGDHAREKAPAELDEGEDVEADLVQLLVERKLVKAAVRAKAGVVDEPVDDETAPLRLLRQRRPRARLGEVGGQNVRLDPVVVAQRRRHRLEPVPATGHERHVAALPRHAPRQRLADAARGARDERHLSCHGASCRALARSPTRV
jgi:undecaprenyl-diphosphatase